jgi:hypothetical protein
VPPDVSGRKLRKPGRTRGPAGMNAKNLSIMAGRSVNSGEL